MKKSKKCKYHVASAGKLSRFAVNGLVKALDHDLLMSAFLFTFVAD